MKKILFLLFNFIASYLISQINYTTPNMPTSPEVAKLSQYGNVPVNNFSGNASPSIPIYVIKEGGLEIPINLTYTSSGIKIEEQATWVGLGWELRPEGVITQEVRGRNDDSGMLSVTGTSYQTIYDRLNNLPPLDFQKAASQVGLATVNLKQPQIITCADDSPSAQIEPQDPEIPIIRLDEGYGQPDIFNFSFMGHTGEFYINPDTGNIVQLDKKEEIKWERNQGGIYKYIATTNDGVKFYFGDMETIYYNGAPSQSQYDNYTFKLTKIRLVNGNEIFFDYQDGKYYNIFYTQENIIRNSLSPDAGDSMKYMYKKPTPKYFNSNTKILKRIRTKEVIVEFNLEDRSDVYPTTQPLKRVASIDIISSSNQKKIKSFQFNYEYFPYSEVGFPSTENLNSNNDAFGKRLKLKKVSEVFYKADDNVDIVKTQDYILDYNLSNVLPSKLSFSKDFWGYYNGSQGNSLTPKMDYFIARGYIGDQTMDNNYTANANNKFSNNTYKDAYMLNKITYPTKGYTVFEYESNTFSNEYIPTAQEEGALNTTISFNNNGTGPLITSNPMGIITLSTSKKVRFVNTIYRGIPNAPMQTQAYSYNQMLNAGATIRLFKVGYNQNGNEVLTEIKKWDLTMVLATSFETNLKAEWDEEIKLAAGNYKLQLYINNNMYSSTDLYHIAGVTSKVFYYKDPTVNISTQMGARIANIKNYDSNGNMLSSKKYSYVGGRSNNKFNLLTQYNMYEFETYTDKPIPLTISYFSINGADVNSYVTYSEVKVSDLNTETETEKGSISYSYYNFGNHSYPLFPIQKNPLNGLLYMETIKDGNKKIVQNTYKYKDISNNERFLSVQSYNRYINDRPFPLRKNNGFCYPKHNYYITPLITKFYKQDSIITKNFIQNDSIIDKNKFEYNNLGLLKKKQDIYGNTINSIEYKYSADVGNYFLNSKDIIGIPLVVETKKTVNGITKKLLRTETYYPESAYEAQLMTSGLPLPYAVGSFGSESSTEKIDVYYNQYDSKGNLIYYTLNSDHNGLTGTPVAIIWGYNNTHPIAKIEGATYAQVSSLASAIINASNDDANDAVSGNPKEGDMLIALDAFRNNSTLAGFQITTYTYDPLIGVRSITPPSGVREVYIYDTANRLKEVKDVNGNILKSYEYHYKP